MSAKQSSIKRHRDQGKGRQVDCVVGKQAYEFKIRVTIAASGQGRWEEELDFPVDCRESGYSPVLVVLDPTTNPKLNELSAAFTAQRGEVYLGDAAWAHLDSVAGHTMSVFLDKYVRAPMKGLLTAAPQLLPTLSLTMTGESITIRIGNELLLIHREPADADGGDDDGPAEDVADGIAGV